jgi:hypothetical protein
MSEIRRVSHRDHVIVKQAEVTGTIDQKAGPVDEKDRVCANDREHH